MVGGERWMMKLVCGRHNHALVKSLLDIHMLDEKIIIGDMTKSMVKPRNILLTLKKHNVNSYITMKQVYNARYAYRSFIRDNNNEMQQLMKLLERDQLKDENVVRDIFWSHPDVVKLSNACNLVFLIDSTYKTNRYRLSLLDIVGLTPTWMTFSTAFAYLECCLGSRPVSRCDALPGVIITDRDLALMNVVKTIFPESTNLFFRFHIDTNVKEKCKILVAQKNT
ncbi:Protein FAR1-RELATED SEQUENCE 5 [Glycine max]|nr:Protein FAR1-RELATED SEQUENCE 5 [Glycine max]